MIDDDPHSIGDCYQTQTMAIVFSSMFHPKSDMYQLKWVMSNDEMSSSRR